MNQKQIFYLALLFSVAIIILNAPIFLNPNNPPYSATWTGLLLTFLPLAVLALAFYFFKGKQYRAFYVMLGVIFMALFWEISPDPWSIQMRSALGLPLSDVLVYTLLGIAVLLLAYFAFKRGFEE